MGVRGTPRGVVPDVEDFHFKQNPPEVHNETFQSDLFGLEFAIGIGGEKEVRPRSFVKHSSSCSFQTQLVILSRMIFLTFAGPTTQMKMDLLALKPANPTDQTINLGLIFHLLPA